MMMNSKDKVKCRIRKWINHKGIELNCSTKEVPLQVEVGLSENVINSFLAYIVFIYLF
jgi:hypothetical protein